MLAMIRRFIFGVCFQSMLSSLQLLWRSGNGVCGLTIVCQILQGRCRLDAFHEVVRECCIEIIAVPVAAGGVKVYVLLVCIK